MWGKRVVLNFPARFTVEERQYSRGRRVSGRGDLWTYLASCKLITQWWEKNETTFFSYKNLFSVSSFFFFTVLTFGVTSLTPLPVFLLIFTFNSRYLKKIELEFHNFSHIWWVGWDVTESCKSKNLVLEYTFFWPLSRKQRYRERKDNLWSSRYRTDPIKSPGGLPLHESGCSSFLILDFACTTQKHVLLAFLAKYKMRKIFTNVLRAPLNIYGAADMMKVNFGLKSFHTSCDGIQVEGKVL